MFQTDIVISLQAFGSEILTRFLLVLTMFGYSEVQIPLVIILGFGLNFRKGLLVVQILLVTSILTEYLKVLFAMPRPVDVDPAVNYLGNHLESVEAAAFYRDAPSFLSVLPSDTLKMLRSAGVNSYGFPSGHCSGTAALWASVAMLFRKRLLWVAAAGAIGLIAFSRVYLGRHFLGDAVGGAALGLAVALCFVPLLGKRTWSRIENQLGLLAWHRWDPALRFYLALLPLAGILLATPDGSEDAGRLFGLNLGLVCAARTGLPYDAAPWGRRLMRTLLAGGCYLLVSSLIQAAVQSAYPSDTPVARFATGALVTLSFMVVSVELSSRLHLFEPA